MTGDRWGERELVTLNALFAFRQGGVSPCDPGCSGVCYADQAGLRLICLSASQVLG